MEANRARDPRIGNLQRAEWRQKCRQLLAEHLRTKLGIAIDPHRIRLRTDPRHDGYTWAPVSGHEHRFQDGLFAKQLSKHSVGAYMTLCREVGRYFEAVSTWDRERSRTAGRSPETEVAVSATIHAPPARRAATSDGPRPVRQHTRTGADEHHHRCREVRQLQDEIDDARDRILRLTRRNHLLCGQVRQLQRRHKRHERSVVHVLPVLEMICATLKNGCGDDKLWESEGANNESHDEVDGDHQPSRADPADGQRSSDLG
ncbi:uncharacterized protein A1O9_13081 [Exophiala aquamarina CBS 119918]|uniref:Uncharacterized protein n=1 Tax=Exophiala aquamarina CBS 119918 TaxID=1182545 RepID=A0A072NSP0_9EURO|nr:uncharacterized protein A1O9_13081 [Exophiala aquamarina CBS 119918]KEF50869.1 hypothetical protein A1O9_13081 [Exophiala aquamarina CBS 119918]